MLGFSPYGASVLSDDGARNLAVAAQEAGQDGAAVTLTVALSLAVSAQEAGDDRTFIFIGPVVVLSLSAQEAGADSAMIAALRGDRNFWFEVADPADNWTDISDASDIWEAA